MFEGVDLEKELLDGNDVLSQELFLNQAKALLNEDARTDAQALSQIRESNGTLNELQIDRLDPSRVIHIDDIERLCVTYRLRFLDSKYFKGDIPQVALARVRRLQNDHQAELKGFKIIAPSGLFRLEDPNKDPMLLVPLTEDRFYLVHKWGNDMKWYRKLISYPVRDVYSMGLTVLAVSLLIALALPKAWLVQDPEQSAFSMRYFIFLYSAVAISAMCTFLGFQFAKNFSSALWDSRYFRY